MVGQSFSLYRVSKKKNVPVIHEKVPKSCLPCCPMYEVVFGQVERFYGTEERFNGTSDKKHQCSNVYSLACADQPAVLLCTNNCDHPVIATPRDSVFLTRDKQ